MALSSAGGAAPSVAAGSPAPPSKLSPRLLSIFQGFKRPGVREVWPQELYARIRAQDKGLVIVDARADAERQVSVLPGPTVTPEQYEELRSALSSPTLVVCYCTAGLRSANCAVNLQQQERAAAATQPEFGNLVGGILGWAQEQLPLVELADRTKHTQRVHVWAQKFAGDVGPGYEPVWFPAASPTLFVTLLRELAYPRAWWSALWQWLGWASARRRAAGSIEGHRIGTADGAAVKGADEWKVQS